jgi:hypothetical protein
VPAVGKCDAKRMKADGHTAKDFAKHLGVSWAGEATRAIVAGNRKSRLSSRCEELRRAYEIVQSRRAQRQVADYAVPASPPNLGSTRTAKYRIRGIPMNISTAVRRLAAAAAAAGGFAVLSAPLAPANAGDFCLNVPFVSMCIPGPAAPPPAPQQFNCEGVPPGGWNSRGEFCP